MRVTAEDKTLVVHRDPQDKYPRERDWWNKLNSLLFGQYEVREPSNDLCPRQPQTFLKARYSRIVRVNTTPLMDEWATGRVLLVKE